MTEDVEKVLNRSRKLVEDSNGVVDKSRIEAEALINKSKALLAVHARSEAAKGLLEMLPQGHGSGLNADMVDGLHAAEILAKARAYSGGGGSGSGSGDATSIQGKTVDVSGRGNDTIIVFKTAQDKYIHETKSAPAAHASTHQNGGSDEVNVAGLSGELADPQPPKTHGDSAHSESYEKTGNKGSTNGYCGLDGSALVALSNIPGTLTGKSADQVDGCHAGLAANNVFKILAAIATGDIFYVDATPQVTRLPKGSDGQVLKLVSGLPAWQNEGGGTSHDILSATHTDTLAAAVVRGDLLIGNATPKWARLPIGLSGKVLKSDGTDPSWGQLATSELSGHDKAAHDALGIDADKVDGSHAADFAPASKGVTNGDSHDHNGGDGAQIDHANLGNKGTNTHPQIDTHLAASAPHSGHEQTANKGQASGYCDLDSNAKVPTTRMPTAKVKTTSSFAVTGTLATGTDKAPTILAPCSLTITVVKLVVKTAPTGQAIIVDVNKNGTTIFTTQGNRPQIAAGSTTGDSGTPDVTSLAEGDKITIDVDQVGSGTAGVDLTVEVVADQAVVFS